MQLFNAEKQSGSIYELSFNKDWITQQKPLVQIHAYCLLFNHYHLLVTQMVDGGISEFMKRLSGGYTAHFNERYDRSGALFQGNYKRVQCTSNEQLLYLAAYVNLNNKIHDTKQYVLSSLPVYSGDKTESFVFPDLILKQYKNSRHFMEDAARLVQQIAQKRKLEKVYDKENLLE